MSGFPARVGACLCALACIVHGGEATRKRDATQAIDLAAALRLAGANNLDVQIARQRVVEAEANEILAVEQFFPSITPGLSYRRHEGNIQAVQGDIIRTNDELYTAGASATAQVDVGEAIFRTLAARQLAHAVKHAAAAQEQETIYRAALGYFELARTQAAVGVAVEAERIAGSSAAEIEQAVKAGLAFKGDLYRASTEVERDRLAGSQARQQRRLAASALAEILQLDPVLNLMPAGGELTTVRLASSTAGLEGLVAEALAARPEMKQFAAQLEAARKNKQAAVYGPLVPRVNGQVFYGGLGGGIGNPGPADFGQSSDYTAGFGWRIGPGGLFDRGRIRAQTARVRVGELELEKTGETVAREVVDAHTRVHASAEQIAASRRGLESARQTLELTRQRREFGVGEVLETIQAEQELTRARLDYVNAVAEYNKAQYGLERARGGLGERRGGK